MAVFTLGTDYLLDNSRQTDNPSKREKETVLILDESSSLYPLILTDFEQGWPFLC